jgi:hypothetical protein
MNVDEMRFVYYVEDCEGVEVGAMRRLSFPMIGADQLIAFVKLCLLGDEEPDASMFKYDEYVAFLEMARKEPFDFEGSLYGVAEHLHDVGHEVIKDFSLADVMSLDEDFCKDIRESYTKGSKAPIAVTDKLPFLLYLLEDVCMAFPGHDESLIESVRRAEV